MDQVAAFASPDMGRFFIACDRCRRVVPHYRVYGSIRGVKRPGMCKCGGLFFRPVHLNELHAAWWVLGIGWLWRKTICRETEWDPRMPIRMDHARAEIPQ